MSRYIQKGVRQELLNRSKGLCECCGSAGSSENHHLLEYHLGGPNTLINLLVLCPSCHEQVPKYLSLDQQRMLQEWHHQNGTDGNMASIAQFRTMLPEIDIGTVVFRNVRDVMATDDQSIIALHEEPSGFYINIVMLDDAFTPKLLVLSNKVIVNGGYTINVSQKRVAISDAISTWFEVCSVPQLMLRGQIKYRDEMFIFTDEGFQFRGINWRYVKIDCANHNNVALLITDDYTTFNFGGASLRILNKK